MSTQPTGLTQQTYSDADFAVCIQSGQWVQIVFWQSVSWALELESLQQIDPLISIRGVISIIRARGQRWGHIQKVRKSFRNHGGQERNTKSKHRGNIATLFLTGATHMTQTQAWQDGSKVRANGVLMTQRKHTPYFLCCSNIFPQGEQSFEGQS